VAVRDGNAGSRPGRVTCLGSSFEQRFVICTAIRVRVRYQHVDRKLNNWIPF